MSILRILRIKIKMEVPFLYMKFWTNQYKNKISPKYMYKNRTFCSQLVFIFFKVLLAGRQCRQQLKTLYTPGLLEIIWELFAKKSADILSFRHSFTLSISTNEITFDWSAVQWLNKRSEDGQNVIVPRYSHLPNKCVCLLIT